MGLCCCDRDAAPHRSPRYCTPPGSNMLHFRYKNLTDAIQIFGKELIWRRLDDESDDESDYEDQEREPLLGNE